MCKVCKNKSINHVCEVCKCVFMAENIVELRKNLKFPNEIHILSHFSMQICEIVRETREHSKVAGTFLQGKILLFSFIFRLNFVCKCVCVCVIDLSCTSGNPGPESKEGFETDQSVGNQPERVQARTQQNLDVILSRLYKFDKFILLLLPFCQTNLRGNQGKRA